MELIRSDEGWFVLHLFCRLDRFRWGRLDESAHRTAREEFLEALAEFERHDSCQVRTYAVLGHKADLCVLLIDPELQHLNRTENRLLASFPDGAFTPTFSYLSMTEVSEYLSQESDYDRTLREKDKLDPESPEYLRKMDDFRRRIRVYIEERLFPSIPQHKVMCFYPMSKTRRGSNNWYALDFETRKRLMSGHAISGRRYAGKVQQLVTGSAGLDEWEWGVTLFADDPLYLKKIVYEMRFDEASALYGEFGDFLLGIQLPPAEALKRILP